MALDHLFTSARATTANPVALLAAVRAAVSADVGIREREPGVFRAKKNTDWTPAQMTAAQNAIDTAPADTPQLRAQQDFDSLQVSALVGALLAVLDEVNVLRTELNTIRAKLTPPLTPPLPMRTEAQFKTAARNRMGTLS